MTERDHSFLSKKIYHFLRNIIAFLGVILGSAFIGASPIFVRLSAVDPFATGFFRFFFALPFLWTWMVIDTMATKEPRHPKMGKDYFLLSVAGVFFALDMLP